MSATTYVCASCGTPVGMTILDRWPDGSIKEAEWVCATEGCAKPARAWYCDQGTLDLGLVRDEQLADRSDFWIYEPEG